jgi:superfamily II DNA or RNA helicase
MGLIIGRYLELKYGYTIGWVAMRRNILKQVVIENEKIGIENLYPISMFCKDPPKVDILIMDEGHHDATNSASHLHNTLKPKFILGLTATPFRTDRMKLCFEKVVKDIGVRTLIDEGYLSPYHHYTIKDWSPENVCKLYLEEKDKWGKSLMFFLRVEEAMRAAEILNNNGTRTEVVTGKTDRSKQLDAFEAGEIDVITNVYVLTEGFDCPDLKSVFVRPSRKLPTTQMAGRALRIHEDNPHVNIIQSNNTKYPFTKMASAQMQYVMVDGEWRSLKPNTRQIKDISGKALITMAHTNVSLPKILNKKTNVSLNFNRMPE